MAYEAGDRPYNLRIRSIDLGSFLKLSSFAGGAYGACWGLLCVLMGLGGATPLQLDLVGSLSLEGASALVFCAPWMAVLGMFWGGVIAFLMYLPIRGCLRLSGGITLRLIVATGGRGLDEVGREVLS